MEKLKSSNKNTEDYEDFKKLIEKEYADKTGDIYENCIEAAYKVFIEYKTTKCKDHNEPLKFCHKCEEIVAKEIFKRIWDLEFDGLDRKLTPEMEEVLKSFWSTMKDLRREYISDEIWNGGK